MCLPGDYQSRAGSQRAGLGPGQHWAQRVGSAGSRSDGLVRSSSSKLAEPWQETAQCLRLDRQCKNTLAEPLKMIVMCRLADLKGLMDHLRGQRGL